MEERVMRKDTVLEAINKTTDEQVEGLGKIFRESLITIGKSLEDEEFISWAKSLSDNGIIACLHLGFSEKAFIESLVGTVELVKMNVVKKNSFTTH